MSGILCGKRLPEAGYEEVVIYEKASRLGGTWRDNHYPGLECDVPSHVYSYSFAPNPHWSHLFSPGPEIACYLETVAERYRVTPRIRFDSEVTACAWGDGRWRLEIGNAETDWADVVIFATGVLHHPSIPAFEGLETFRGRAFHSARWDDTVTVSGKRLGIVGTGSTAVQIVSAVVDEVASLSLFQRTAQWVFPQPNPAYSADDQLRFEDDPELLDHIRHRMRQSFNENFSNAVVDADSERMQEIEAICRRNLQENVRDPKLRRKLTPDYRAACKRLIMSGSFYDAIQRPHAHLVTEPIDHIEPRGIRTADGVLHPLDVLVLATGFDPRAFMRPTRIVGRGGVPLETLWRDSVFAYRSVSLPGFPNLFMIIGPQSPVGNFSLIDIAERQLEYVLALLQRLRSGECRELSARAGAARRYTEALEGAMKDTIWVTGCRSWYLDDRGIPGTWPFTLDRFEREMRQPDPADFEAA